MVNKNITDFIKIVTENPELKVVPMVDSEIVADDNHGSWMASIGKSRIDEYYHKDEYLYFKSLDLDELKEDLSEIIWLDNEDISDEELEVQVDNYIEEEIGWVKAIIVSIDLP